MPKHAIRERFSPKGLNSKAHGGKRLGKHAPPGPRWILVWSLASGEANGTISSLFLGLNMSLPVSEVIRRTAPVRAVRQRSCFTVSNAGEAFQVAGRRRRSLFECSLSEARCLPPALQQRKDIVAAAETGSGKTLAFGLPILQHTLSCLAARPRRCFSEAPETWRGPEPSCYSRRESLPCKSGARGLRRHGTNALSPFGSRHQGRDPAGAE